MPSAFRFSSSVAFRKCAGPRKHRQAYQSMTHPDPYAKRRFQARSVRARTGAVKCGNYSCTFTVGSRSKGAVSRAPDSFSHFFTLRHALRWHEVCRCQEIDKLSLSAHSSRRPCYAQRDFDIRCVTLCHSPRAKFKHAPQRKKCFTVNGWSLSH